MFLKVRYLFGVVERGAGGEFGAERALRKKRLRQSFLQGAPVALGLGQRGVERLARSGKIAGGQFLRGQGGSKPGLQIGAGRLGLGQLRVAVGARGVQRL